jgi:hypothetical protein
LHRAHFLQACDYVRLDRRPLDASAA